MPRRAGRWAPADEPGPVLGRDLRDLAQPTDRAPSLGEGGHAADVRRWGAPASRAVRANMLVMASIELLYWDGCPSYPEALEELRGVLRDLGRGDVAVALRHVSTDEQARTLGFVGSPTI